MKKLALVINLKDNVATALREIKKGSRVTLKRGRERIGIKLLDDISFGYKFALKDINNGDKIIKYGEVIGKATTLIKSGEHVHVHNVKSQRGRGDLK
jgi:altronate dehydratase small subunit